MTIEWPSPPPNPLSKPRKPALGANLTDEQLIDLCHRTAMWQAQEMIRNQLEMTALRKLVQAYHDDLERTRNNGPRRSAYEVLLDIANDPARDDGARIRAAEAAAQYERPKLTASMNRNETVTSIGDELDRAKLRIAGSSRLALDPRD